MTDDPAGAAPIFRLEVMTVERQRNSYIVAGTVANSAVVIAFSSGLLLQLNLNDRTVMVKSQLVGRTSDPPQVTHLLTDPSGKHTIVSTVAADLFYLPAPSGHSGGKPAQVRPLSTFRGLKIISAGWRLPFVLLGDVAGVLHEAIVDSGTVKYLGKIRSFSGPVAGLWVDSIPGERTRVMVATPTSLRHYIGPARADFRTLFESEMPAAIHSLPAGTTSETALVVSPMPVGADDTPGKPFDRAFAWLSAQGIQHGRLTDSLSAKQDLADSRLLRPVQDEPIDAVALSQWHLLRFSASRLDIESTVDHSPVFSFDLAGQAEAEPDAVADLLNHAFVSLVADPTANSFWIFTRASMVEIVVTDEGRDVWNLFLTQHRFDEARHHARTLAQQDAVATAAGEHSLAIGDFDAAASVLTRSSKPFEQVAIAMIEAGKPDALRAYLTGRLGLLTPAAKTQRTLLATWLVELFMSKLNSLDDAVMSSTNPADDDAVRTQFYAFVHAHKADLDARTTYEIIRTHGRDDELLFFATAIDDTRVVLDFCVHRDRWDHALAVLRRQPDPQLFYVYAGVLLTNSPGPTVDALLARDDLEARKLIPALLGYCRQSRLKVADNQAIRFLNHHLSVLKTQDAAVHNAVLALYAAHDGDDDAAEEALLAYLSSPDAVNRSGTPLYDVDFALRLCVQHDRIRSCVFIHQALGQDSKAVDLALQHDQVELAGTVADATRLGDVVMKQLWLAIAMHVISGPVDGAVRRKRNRRDSNKQNGEEVGTTDTIAAAAAFLQRCPLLKIQDLIPFFPDFVVIDHFQPHIRRALADYTHQIDSLHKEMNEAANATTKIRQDVAALDQRFVLVAAGERCSICGLPVLVRRFLVFPSCQHAFHSDCLAGRIVSSTLGSVKIGDAEAILAKKATRIRSQAQSDSRAVVRSEDMLTDGELAVEAAAVGLLQSPSVQTARKIAILLKSIQVANGDRKKSATTDKIHQLTIQLEDLASDACVLCGDVAVQTIDEPFINDGEIGTEWVL